MSTLVSASNYRSCLRYVALPLALTAIATSAYGVGQNNCDAFVSGSNALNGIATAGQPGYAIGGPGLNGCSISGGATLTSAGTPPADTVETTSTAVNAMATEGDATVFTGTGVIYASVDISGSNGVPTAEATAASIMWQKFELAPGQSASYTFAVTFIGATGTPANPLSFLPTFSSGLYANGVTGTPVQDFSYVNPSTNNAVVLTNGQIIAKRFAGTVTNNTTATVSYYVSSQSTNPTAWTVVADGNQLGQNTLSYSYNFRFKIKSVGKTE